ncbi:MAG: hypothetical protein JJV99_01660 [Colwellia sp.]|nr:hypothetical protein [Colwellia sp.]
MNFFLFRLIAATFSLPAYHVCAAEQDFQFHGFAAQGLIDVNGSNFVNDDGSLSPKLTEFGINGSYQLNDKLRLAGQVVYLNGGNRYAEGVRVDYALLDWSVYDDQNWQGNIYLGRFKNNHWLYSSSRDIPFARPSIILPQSVYFDGFRDIAVGGDGIAIKISHNNDIYGDFDFNFSYGSSSISDKQTEIILSELAQGSLKQDKDIQASFYWQPTFSSWRFGASYLDSDFSYQASDNDGLFFDGKKIVDAQFLTEFYTVNALYEAEYWEFSGEIYQESLTAKGFYQPLFSRRIIGQGAYLQSRYKVNEELTLLARYEHFYIDRNDKNGKKLEEETDGYIPAYFAYHNDTTLGLSYDLLSDLRLRLEYHWFKGTGRLTPVVLPNPTVNDNKYWQLWAIQLMYWF